MSVLRMVYLALAGAGLAYAGLGLFQLFVGSGLSGPEFSGPEFLQHRYANPGAEGLFWGRIIPETALMIWAFAESRARRNWSGFWAVPLTLVFGLVFGLPLYLYLRTRPVL